MTNPSVAMRSAVGDADAIEELCARPDGGHAIAEAVAIGVGLRARAFAQVQELRLELLETPARLENPMTLQAVIERVTDPRTSPEMMDILARIGTPLAADLLYDAWISTPERNSMTEMARRLVYSPEVRRNASAALDIALTLRALESCEGVDALVARAALVGDERVLRPIAQMASWNECKASPDECHPCEVNHGDVAAAVAAAQKRPAPMFLR